MTKFCLPWGSYILNTDRLGVRSNHMWLYKYLQEVKGHWLTPVHHSWRSWSKNLEIMWSKYI